MKQAIVMEKADVSLEKVTMKGGKQRNRTAAKWGLWRPPLPPLSAGSPHLGARPQQHPCFWYLADLWQDAYSTEDTVLLHLKKEKENEDTPIQKTKNQK